MNIAHYYEILGLEPGASEEEVKQAYRDLSRVWHPDRFANEPGLQQKAREKIKGIEEAYEKLILHLSKSYTQSFQKNSKQDNISQIKNSSTVQNEGKKLSFIGWVVGFVIGGMIVMGIKHAIFEPKKSEISKQELIEVANELNKRLPIIVDSETRLDTVIAGPGKKLTYVYTLTNYSSGEVDSQEFERLVLPKAKKEACTNEGTKYFLKKDVRVNAYYQGNDGGFIYEVDVAPSDCGY